MEGLANTLLEIPGYLDLPLHFYHKVPVLPADLDGRSCFLLFDSGAPHLFLNSLFFAPEDLFAGSDVMGASGKVQSQSVRVNSLSMGAWQMGPFEAMAYAAPHWGDFEEGPIAGLLGFRELVHFSWMVDYDASRLHLWRNFKPQDHDLRGEIRIQYQNHAPVFPVEIGGRAFRFLLDTGCSDMVFDKEKQEQIMEAVRDVGKEEMVGAGGLKVEVEHGILDQMRLGELALEDVAVAFSDLSNLQLRLGDFDGILGHPLLSEVRTVVCWERKRLYFLK